MSSYISSGFWLWPRRWLHITSLRSPQQVPGTVGASFLATKHTSYMNKHREGGMGSIKCSATVDHQVTAPRNCCAAPWHAAGSSHATWAMRRFTVSLTQATSSTSLHATAVLLHKKHHKACRCQGLPAQRHASGSLTHLSTCKGTATVAAKYACCLTDSQTCCTDPVICSFRAAKHTPCLVRSHVTTMQLPSMLAWPWCTHV